MKFKDKKCREMRQGEKENKFEAFRNNAHGKEVILMHIWIQKEKISTALLHRKQLVTVHYCFGDRSC